MESIFLSAAVLAIGFLHKITEAFLKKLSPSLFRWTVCVWAALVLLLTFVIKGNYLWSAPHNLLLSLPLFLAVLAVNCFISRRSGYQPQGKWDTFHFAVTYPVFEEIAFRGLILPLLLRIPALTPQLSLWVVFPSIAVLLTALLFAVSHLQYYRLNKQSIRFMLFAFSGGVFFGCLAEATGSILYTVLVHMAFNSTAVWYSRRTIPRT